MKLLHNSLVYLDSIIYKQNEKRKVIRVKSLNEKSKTRKKIQIGGSLVFILWLSRWFGTTPLVFERITGSKWTMKRSSLIEMYGRLLIPVFAIPCGFCVFQFLTSGVTTGFKISVKASDMTIIYVTVIYILMTSHSRTESIMSFIHVLNKMKKNLDLEQRQLEKEDRYRLWCCVLGLTLSAALVMAEQYMQTNAYTNMDLIWMLYGPYSLPQYFLILFYAQFIYLVWMLNTRIGVFLHQLNILKEHQAVFEFCKARSSRKILVQEIRNAVQIQQLMRAAVCHLNDAFSSPMLFIMLSNWLHLSNLALLIIMNSCGEFSVHLAAQFVWFLLHYWWVTEILEPCHKLQTQDEEISYSMLVILTSCIETDSRSGHSNSFLLRGWWRWQRIFERTPSRITGCDVFGLDRSVHSTMASTITTFIIVMLQIPDL